MIAIDCNGLSLFIFEEKWPNYASDYGKIKMTFIWKDDFFFAKIGIFLRFPLTKCI